VAVVTIGTVTVFEFRLPLKCPLPVGKRTLHERQGFLLRIESRDGHVGFGEISPLPCFSRESYDDAHRGLTKIASGLPGQAVPEHLEELSGSFERWLGSWQLPPSVRFGVEAAVLEMAASEQSAPLSGLLSDSPQREVLVSALLWGASDEDWVAQAEALRQEGYATFKLKIGRSQNFEADISRIQRLRQILGGMATLRLDANRSLSERSFMQLSDSLGLDGIEFVEEPLPTTEANLRLARSGCGLPVALDESLISMQPENLSTAEGITAVVLKPTLLGLEKTARFARLAIARDIKPVIGSSFESSLGLTQLAHAAAAICPGGIAAGLATAQWFERDLLTKQLSIKSGRVRLDDLPDISDCLDDTMLTKVL
jgi:O-succinylbenzoate synthase